MTIPPAPELLRTLQLPNETEAVLANGMTVIAVRRPTVPLVEFRLRIPTFHSNSAAGVLLADAMLAGTRDMSALEIASRFQTIGGRVRVMYSPDRIRIGGTVLAERLDSLFSLLVDVLVGATYPTEEVESGRRRLSAALEVAATESATIIRRELLTRIYGSHRYGESAEAADVRAVTPADLRSLHAEHIHARGTTLSLVGDLEPDTAIATAERWMMAWPGGRDRTTLPAIPPLQSGPLELLDWPGAGQSSIRLAMPAVSRSHDDRAALELMNLVFGGYFSSRWATNVREEKGFSYNPKSSIHDVVAGSTLVASAEAATPASGRAFAETLKELRQLVAEPPQAIEVDRARQYAIGSLVLGMSSQSALAGAVNLLAGFGLRLGYFAEHVERLAAVTPADVQAMAADRLAPDKAVMMVLGDASVIGPELDELTAVHVHEHPL